MIIDLYSADINYLYSGDYYNLIIKKPTCQQLT